MLCSLEHRVPFFLLFHSSCVFFLFLSTSCLSSLFFHFVFHCQSSTWSCLFSIRHGKPFGYATSTTRYLDSYCSLALVPIDSYPITTHSHPLSAVRRHPHPSIQSILALLSFLFASRIFTHTLTRPFSVLYQSHHFFSFLFPSALTHACGDKKSSFFSSHSCPNSHLLTFTLVTATPLTLLRRSRLTSFSLNTPFLPNVFLFLLVCINRSHHSSPYTTHTRNTLTRTSVATVRVSKTVSNTRVGTKGNYQREDECIPVEIILLPCKTPHN